MRLNKRGILAVLGLAALLTSGAVGATAASLQGDDLKEMEDLLARLGFKPGTIDGVIDDDAKAAIGRYQAFAALPVDGQPSEALLTELRQVVEQLAALNKPREEAPHTSKQQSTERQAAESRPLAKTAEPPKPAEPKEQAPQNSEKPAKEAAATESPEDLAASTTNLKQPEPPKPTSKSESDLKKSQEESAGQKKPDRKKPDQKKPDQKNPSQPFALEGMISRLLKENNKSPDANESGGGDRGGRDPVSQAEVPQVDGYNELALGFEAATQGEHTLAISHYTRAIVADNLAPKDLAIAHYNRANAHYYGANHESAIVDYDEAIRLWPDFADAYYNRGFSYRAKGERQHAVGDFLKARELGLHRLGVRAPDAIPPSTNPPS